jgi:hypothetical protein
VILRGVEIEKPKNLSPQITQIDADRGKAKSLNHDHSALALSVNDLALL